ncbi:MAG TPA: sigma-70 family RNA polymerase sigma factor [Candidatus Limnocylindrales bacterium]|nr:sigma-70 family RNA polymerase sigma factor [Candidatus Limnocylindrales bacterium]
MSVVVVAAESPEAAYQRAFEVHWEDVFRYALAWTNDWGAAEDLTQDAFLRLWNRRTTVDWERPIVPWLFVAARRLATDRFRALRRRVLPHSIGMPDESVRARWLDVRAAMSTLSPLERTALVLTALEGVAYGEAAELLGTSPGALRAAVARARDKLEAA